MATINNVEVRQSPIPGAGRGVFALRDFAPGDLVISVPRPLVTELHVDRLDDTCAWCFQRALLAPEERLQALAMGLPSGSVAVKSCTGCRRVVYCSKACQAKAWKREHKYECKLLGKSSYPLPPFMRAAIKLLGRCAADFVGNKAVLDDVMCMQPYLSDSELKVVEKTNKELFDDLQMFAFGAWTLLGKPRTLGNLDAQTVARAVVFNAGLNSFDVGSALDSEKFGVGFDPLVCSANHSCEPNVEGTFHQPSYTLRALREIKKGDEVFMKYTDVTNPFSVRQADLKQRYFFDCQCSLCRQGPVQAIDIFAKAPDKLSAEYCKKADSFIKRHGSVLARHILEMPDKTAQKRLAALQAEAFAVAVNETATVDEIREAIKMCIGSGMWVWTRQPVPQLCEKLFGAYVGSGEVYRAFRVGVKIYFHILPVLSPQPFTPDRLINLWSLSIASNMLCGPAGAEVFKEMLDSGIHLWFIYLGFLLELHDNIPQMYAMNTPFGLVIKNTYEKIMAGVNLSEEEIRAKTAAIWPSFEILARNVTAESL